MTASAQSTRTAHVIRSDAEAIAVAHKLAARFAVEASLRDRERRLPVDELDEFSASGLWGITIAKAYGGAGVSYVTVAEVIKIISAADSSLGQISQIIQAAVDTGIAVGALEETKRYAREARPWIDSQQDHGWQDPFSIAAIGDLEWRSINPTAHRRPMP